MQRSLPDRFSRNIFFGFGLLTLLSIFVSVITEEYVIAILPVILVITATAMVNARVIFLFLFALIPISTEFYMENGLSTDLPTEPLMVLLMLVFFLYIAKNPSLIHYQFLSHPATLILVLHLFWVGFALFFTQDIVVTLKFFLAKLWYIIVFYFMTVIFVQKREDFMKLFWLVLATLVLVTLIILGHHATYNFRFDDVNKSVVPFFRNHVNYAALLSIMLPFIFFAKNWYDKKSIRRTYLNISMIILLVAIFYSYTRGAWLSIGICIAAYYIIRFKLLRYAIVLALIGLGIFINYLFTDNSYLKYEPQFEKTIYHEKFADHFEATFAMEDVSSAERIYRWIASYHMFKDKPFVGHGPGNFYPYYKSYTIRGFETYVSENEDKSTVHNYFLLLLVEQGIIGLMIFTVFVVLILIIGERAYHKARNVKEKSWMIALLLSFVIILVHIQFSDLIEVDKVGPIFFMNAALIISQSLRINGRLKSAA